MSAPFVYTPGPAPVPQLPPAGPYVQPYLIQPQRSPFIPPNVLPGGQISPYNPPIQLGPPSPYHQHVHFHEEPPARPRSWHAPDETPFVWPIPAPPLEPAPAGGRRRSFNGGQPGAPWAQLFSPPPAASPSPYLYAPAAIPQYALLHPFLDARIPRHEFAFDLSAPAFSPQRLYGPHHPPVALAHTELDMPATHPGVQRMRIVCDAIPEWPIELKFSAGSPFVGGGLGLSVTVPGWPSPAQPQQGGAPPVPITLRDVLEAVYRALHTQITHLDWAKLSKSEEMAIGRAYTRRCKEDKEGNQATAGVKRIDFLLDKFMFQGLVAIPGTENFSEMKLITAARR